VLGDYTCLGYWDIGRMFPGIGILVYPDGPRSVYRDMPISRYMEFSQYYGIFRGISGIY